MSEQELYSAKNELGDLRFKVVKIKCPIPAKEALKILDSEHTLKWCCQRMTRVRGIPTTFTDYEVVTPRLRQRGYFVVFTTPESGNSDTVTSIRLAFEAPLDGLYFADLDEFTELLELDEKRANQAPEPTPTSVTPPAGQEARQP